MKKVDFPNCIILSEHAALFFDDELFKGLHTEKCEDSVEESESEEQSEEEILSDNKSIIKLNEGRSEKEIQTESHTSKQLGIDGECLVQKALKNCFSQVVLVSGTGHMGDIHVFEEQYSIMVEVKNKQVSTQEDYEKFRKDFIIFSERQKNAWCLYISLQEEQPWRIEDRRIYIYGLNSLNSLNIIKMFLEKEELQKIKEAVFSQINYDNELERLFLYTEKLKDYNNLIQQIQLQSKIVESLKKRNEKLLEENEVKMNEREQLKKLLQENKSVKKTVLVNMFPHLNLGKFTLDQIKQLF